jgi:hypothetical protein
MITPLEVIVADSKDPAVRQHYARLIQSYKQNGVPYDIRFVEVNARSPPPFGTVIPRFAQVLPNGLRMNVLRFDFIDLTRWLPPTRGMPHQAAGSATSELSKLARYFSAGANVNLLVCNTGAWSNKELRVWLMSIWPLVSNVDII